MVSDSVWGYLAVTGAALFFGSFGVPLKTKRVQEANVDPVVFQIYYSISIFLSCWLVLIYEEFVFTPWGIAGAGLWVPASILSIAAINHLGMSVAVGVWAGVTILVSFAWGATVFSHTNHIQSLPLALVALVLLIVGIMGLSLSNTSVVKGKSEPVDDSSIQAGESSAPLIPNQHLVNQRRKNPIIGFTCCILLGIMNGSMMVPMQYVPHEASGIRYLISFSIGVIIVTPVIATIYFIIMRRRPVFHLKQTLVPGLITGFIWSIGNFFSIYAVVYLGLTIGFPLTQLALVVSGLWGIIVFRELKGARTLAVWFISAFVLLGGAFMLARFG